MRYWLFLVSALGLPGLAIELPEIGTSADTTLSPAEEQKLGEAFFRQLHRQMTVIEDLEINAYLNSLGQQLISYSENSQQQIHFFVVKEPSINAFAVPGGFIGLHSGLILTTHDESELASVLAHEIAHLTQRHLARTLQASQHLTLPALAALIVAGIASAKNPEIGQAAVASIMAGNLQMQINFTRTHEQEADRVGMQMLAAAGFDPRSMPRFFERLQMASRYEEEGAPDFLRTHPVTTERIAESRSRAEQFPKKWLNDNPVYHLMKAKLRVVIEDQPLSLLGKLREMLKEGRYRDERATRYALALTLLASHQTQGIQEQLEWLKQHDRDRVTYHLLRAQFAWQQGNQLKSLQIYEQALQIYPRDPRLTLDYAEKLLQNNSAQEAKKVLLTMAPWSNPDYYQLLAQTYQRLEARVPAHLAMAEHYYLTGQTALAVDQLKQARQVKNLDFITSSRLEARYQELKQELAEEQADLKVK